MSHLVKANQLLKDDGLLVLKTPNRPSIVFYLVSCLLWFGRSKGQSLIHIPNQLYHFTPDTLENMVKKSGFQLLYTTPIKEVEKNRRISWDNIPSVLFAALLRTVARFESFMLFALKSSPCEAAYE